MRVVARVVGIVWMLACAVLWVWIGFTDFGFQPFGELPPVLANWSIFAFLQDTKFGLTFAPFLLGAVGAIIFSWGEEKQSGA